MNGNRTINVKIIVLVCKHVCNYNRKILKLSYNRSVSFVDEYILTTYQVN